MDNKEFWDAVADLSFTVHDRDRDWSVSVEELYQHFAERFRRENVVAVDVGKGGVCGGEIQHKED